MQLLIKFVIKILVLSTIVGCKASNFSGSTQTKKSEPVKAPTSQPTPTNPPQQIPPSLPNVPCNASGITVARALTSSVVNNAPGQLIRYSLSISDCAGNLRTIQAGPIMFDINSEVSTNDVRPLQYGIFLESNAPIGNGILEVVSGGDLFGNIGPNYFFNRTLGALSAPQGTKAIIFTVDVSMMAHHIPGSQGATQFPPQEQITTYLKFGEAAPVAQVIMFINR